MSGIQRHEIRVRYVSWSSIQVILAELAKRVIGSYKPDILIAIAKGGLIPSRILLDLLGIEEMGVVEVKFYKGPGVRIEKPFIKSIAIPPLKDKMVLVVDDVVDTGRTIQLVIDTISPYAPRAVKTMVLYLKPWSTYMPDYFYEVTSDWIVFPWEICETRREGIHLDDYEFGELGKHCVSLPP